MQMMFDLNLAEGKQKFHQLATDLKFRRPAAWASLKKLTAGSKDLTQSFFAAYL